MRPGAEVVPGLGEEGPEAFSKVRLSKVAKRLGVSGRSKMNKKQLVGAIQKADRKAAKKKA